MCLVPNYLFIVRPQASHKGGDWTLCPSVCPCGRRSMNSHWINAFEEHLPHCGSWWLILLEETHSNCLLNGPGHRYSSCLKTEQKPSEGSSIGYKLLEKEMLVLGEKMKKIVDSVEKTRKDAAKLPPSPPPPHSPESFVDKKTTGSPSRSHRMLLRVKGTRDGNKLPQLTQQKGIELKPEPILFHANLPHFSELYSV